MNQHKHSPSCCKAQSKRAFPQFLSQSTAKIGDLVPTASVFKRMYKKIYTKSFLKGGGVKGASFFSTQVFTSGNLGAGKELISTLKS